MGLTHTEVEGKARMVDVSEKEITKMEAIVGDLSAAATIYDMIKAVDRAAVITDVRLVQKSGDTSGTFIRET